MVTTPNKGDRRSAIRYNVGFNGGKAVSESSVIPSDSLDRLGVGTPFGEELMVSVDTIADLGELACVMGNTSKNDDWGLEDPDFQQDPSGLSDAVTSLN